ncbi:MAG: methionyl-tRNA formyltransferase [Vicinamibacterales bacterium]
MVAALRVVFFGTPAFAVPALERLLASPHRVVGVVTQPDRPRGRGYTVTDAPVKALAVERGVPVVQPPRLREPEVETPLRAWRPDLGVVAAYGKLIPDHLLTLPRLGMINVHASLLPKYRGAAPVQRAVMAGETETGVTIMRVIHDLDAGGTFAQATRAIGGDETSVDVERDLAILGAGLLVGVIDAIAAGSAQETPQDDAQATYAPKVRKEEGPIDWAQPARRIHDQVRGLHPWPHAHTVLGGARVIVLRTRVEAPVACPEPAGTVVHVSRDGLEVMAGDGGAIAIERLQPEGRRPMSVREFLAGHPVARGARLGGA